jgi:hypothetical protein
MMSYEKWLACIVEAAGHIASREYQERAWFANNEVMSSPDEMYLGLMEDCTFNLFLIPAVRILL